MDLVVDIVDYCAGESKNAVLAEGLATRTDNFRKKLSGLEMHLDFAYWEGMKFGKVEMGA